MSATPSVVAALPIYRERSRRHDIWWTPFTMLVPLADGKDRVEIYVRRKPFPALLQPGQLRMEDNDGSSVLAAGDISLRFNNSDRVRGERVALLLACAAMCGAAALMLLLVLTERLAYRGAVAR